MVHILNDVRKHVSEHTFEQNIPLIAALAQLPAEERKEQFFRILSWLEIKVAAHCIEANREVHQFSEIKAAFTAAEQTRH